MIERRGEGTAGLVSARPREGWETVGLGEGGKRVNRESTCKQATRETNNVGAAGCSPPNEASRQEAGRQAGRPADRQTGRQEQACVRSLRCSVFRPCVFIHCAPSVDSSISLCSTYQIARAGLLNVAAGRSYVSARVLRSGCGCGGGASKTRRKFGSEGGQRRSGQFGIARQDLLVSETRKRKKRGKVCA